MDPGRSHCQLQHWCRDTYAVFVAGKQHELYGQRHQRCEGPVKQWPDAVHIELHYRSTRRRHTADCNERQSVERCDEPAVNSAVTVNFSEAMTAATVNTSTFTLTPTSGGSPVAATVNYNANAATLTPSSALANSTSYTVNVTSGAKDLANNGLTRSARPSPRPPAVMSLPPTVTMMSPVNGATGVATNAGMIFRFSEAMNLSTINTSTVTLAPSGGGSPVAGVISFHLNNVVLFQPSANLATGTTYLFTVTTGTKDVAGNGLASNYEHFHDNGRRHDASDGDERQPAQRGDERPVNSAVIRNFSEAMTAATVNTSTFTLTPTSGGSPVAASVVYNSGAATLTPSSALAFSTSYTINVTSGAKDLANNGLTPFSSAFTTAAAPDITPPTVTSVNPLNAATNVPVNSAVTVTFSEAMTAATVNTSTFTLTPTSGGSPVSASVVLTQMQQRSLHHRRWRSARVTPSTCRAAPRISQTTA